MRPCHCHAYWTPRLNRSTAGFTMVELVMTMIIVGVLAFVALPRLSQTSEFQAAAFRDEVVAALRHAQKTALSRRRLVCADFTSSSVTLRVASANPAASCGAATLNAPDGQSPYVRGSGNFIVGNVGPIHFQPSGVATSNAGVVTDYTISIAGAAPVTVVGATGYVN